MTYIQKRLFELQDIDYKDFTAKLIPNIDVKTIIGVRTPMLRKLAKEVSDKSFLQKLPHKYYEENNFHAFMIADIKDYDECIAEINRFLPCIDNWATCDSLRPKCFLNNRQNLILDVKRWIESKHTYTVRFGIEMLMVHFLDEDFKSEYHDLVLNVKSNEYYVNMMIAWYFATALAKKWDSTVIFLTENRLSPWVHNKTIQKAIESYRITDEKKEYLRNLKRS